MYRRIFQPPVTGPIKFRHNTPAMESTSLEQNAPNQIIKEFKSYCASLVKDEEFFLLILNFGGRFKGFSEEEYM